MTEAEAQVRPSDTDVVPGDAAPEAPPAATAPTVDNPLPEERYLNRELSWLDFNARVLALAADTSLPLLERAKFLAIFSSNLDEFYMVRVAGLKRRDEMGLSVRSADGLSPREQLRRISERTQQIASRCAHVFLDSVRPALADEGILIVTWAGARRRRAGQAVDLLPRAGVPGADAAGRRPGAPVPVRERAEPEPGDHRQGIPTTAASTSPESRCPTTSTGSSNSTAAKAAPRALPADGGTDRGLPAGAVPRPGDRRAPRLPHHPQRGLRGRRGPRRGSAAGARARTGAPPLRLAGAARGRRRHDREHARAAAARARRGPRRRHRGARAAGPVVAVADLRRRPARS